MSAADGSVHDVAPVVSRANRIVLPDAAAAVAASPVPAAPAVPASAAEPVRAQWTAGPRGPLTALRHRDFRLLWAGAFVSNAGTWLQNVALSWLVLEITGSPFWVSMVTFTQFFPMIIFGLPGGLAADRLERRRVLIAAQSVMMGVAFTLAAISFTGHASVATLLPVLAVGGVAMAFNAPAFHAIVSDLVPRETVLDAVSLNTAQFSASRVVGPLFGGLIVATVGAGWAFTVNGATFVAVLVALAAIRPARPDPPASSGRRALLGGVRAMKTAPATKTILVVMSTVSLFAAPVLALMPVVADRVLGLGAKGYGGLFAAFSAGAVVGSLLTARIVRALGLRRAVEVGVATLAVSCLALAVSRNVALSSFALAAIGFAYTGTVSATNTGMHLSVPPGKRGRVMSLYMMAWAGLLPVGSIAAGIAATHVGAPATLVACAAALAVAAVAVRVRGGALATIKGLSAPGLPADA